ncbi:hypothetical protein SUDANB121_01890 [Nocardiopsis dassonvillei]|uniref:hypothetical protein n=1 Tax=Nocardiopsis dassonvillei TaxID=2014 RepID=UPI003F558156
MTETQKKTLDELVREELGAEPSQEAMDYARLLYERYRLPEAPAAPEEGTAAGE